MKENLAKYIDHTILSPFATEDMVIQYCNEAKEYNFASVCVNPSRVKTVYDHLKDSDVKVCTVVGFPLGADILEAKVLETLRAIEDGADEIDMVINIGKLKDGDTEYIKNEVETLKRAVKEKILKVIIETCFLNEEEKIIMCNIVRDAGADFIKTSTGFGTKGADLQDIKIMKKSLGNDVKIKASGGIRSLDDMRLMIEEGAERIGTSSGIKIIEELVKSKN